MSATRLASYIHHARVFGGLHAAWETAVGDSELRAVELGELAVTLRQLALRRRRVGRRGRTVQREAFRLSRAETATLVRRLLDAGISDAEIRRVTGVSEALLGEIRSYGGQTLTNRRSQAQASQAISRYTIATTTDRPSSQVEGLRSPDSRTCLWCSAPLPSSLREDARYCAGGICRVAAHRTRLREASA